MSELRDKKETDHTLKEFGKSTLALRGMLKRHRPLDEMEVLFIENHIQVLQMAYLEWKRKTKQT